MPAHIRAAAARAREAVARLPERALAPCFEQTEEAVKAWMLAHVAVGAEVVVRTTHYHTLSYARARVVTLGPAKGRFRVAVVEPDGSLGPDEAFYFSGKHCFYPKGQTRLVIPTPGVLAAADALAAAARGTGAPPWGFLSVPRISLY